MSTLLWMAVVERTIPRASDVLGSVVCLVGAAISLYGGRWLPA